MLLTQYTCAHLLDRIQVIIIGLVGLLIYLPFTVHFNYWTWVRPVYQPILNMLRHYGLTLSITPSLSLFSRGDISVVGLHWVADVGCMGSVPLPPFPFPLRGRSDECLHRIVFSTTLSWLI